MSFVSSDREVARRGDSLSQGVVADRLLEREGDLARIEELLDSVDGGRGRVLLISGAAGIGKSSLLEACAERAFERRMVVLRARGDEFVMESSFAAVRELLWSVIEASYVGSKDLLDGAAALARSVFEGGSTERVGPDRVAGVLHGLYWLVANLTDRNALVLLLDDAHWLDEASARFVVYLARRVASLPVLLVAAVREGEGSDAAGLTTALLGAAGSVLRPDPLSGPASQKLVRRELGPWADDEVCRSCHEVTGGNPFYLRELTAALKGQEGRPAAEVARRLRSLGASAISRSVLVRLSRLDADCGRLAQALAVLAPGSPLRHAALLAGLERERAEVAGDTLRAANLLDAGPELTFAHPIVREAVTAQIPPSCRASLHGRAARLLIDEGAPVDQVSVHLLSAEPYGERWVIDVLREAAGEALARGAPEAAVSCLRRALAEPPTPQRRLELLRELGRAEAMLPVMHDFPALREALELACHPEQRAEIALDLAWALTGAVRNADVAAVLEGVLERSEGLDPKLVERVEALLLGAGAPCLAATDRVLRRVAPLDRAMRGDVTDPVMLAALANTAAVAGLPGCTVTALARRALRNGRLLVDYPSAHLGAAAVLDWAGELEEAAAAADEGIADAQRRGSAPHFMPVAALRGAIALHAGDLPLAEAHAERAYELAQELGAGHFAAMVYIPVLLERGRWEKAFEIVQTLGMPAPLLELWHGVIVMAQRGCVYVAQGELQRGVADLLDADRRMAEHGLHLSVVSDWVPTAVLALGRLGRDGEARHVAERELEDAIAFGSLRRHGIALSVCGLLDRGAAGLSQLTEAVAILERSPARLEHARALVNLGSGLRVRGLREQARGSLMSGLDLAHQCGGSVLVERALAELIATGARPRREAISGPGALTPAELRTARMAAGGLGNRAIAQALFLSAKTVEAQLSHAYAKLGIASRSELAGALHVEQRQNIRVPPAKE